MTKHNQGKGAYQIQITRPSIETIWTILQTKHGLVQIACGPQSLMRRLHTIWTKLTQFGQGYKPCLMKSQAGHTSSAVGGRRWQRASESGRVSAAKGSQRDTDDGGGEERKGIEAPLQLSELAAQILIPRLQELCNGHNFGD